MVAIYYVFNTYKEKFRVWKSNSRQYTPELLRVIPNQKISCQQMTPQEQSVKKSAARPHEGIQTTENVTDAVGLVPQNFILTQYVKMETALKMRLQSNTRANIAQKMIFFLKLFKVFENHNDID
ncbi:unnamed protein product [Caenorhabditis nigoni]